MGLLDSLMIATPTNEFLERLDGTLDWKPLEKALQAMYPATTGRPPCAPLALFKMSLLQHCYGLSEIRRDDGNGNPAKIQGEVMQPFQKVADSHFAVFEYGKEIISGRFQKFLVS